MEHDILLLRRHDVGSIVVLVNDFALIKIRFIFKLFLLLLLWWVPAGCGHPFSPRNYLGSHFPVVFAYQDEKASRVCLAGTFNNWSRDSHCMNREGVLWRAQLILPPGRYEYLLVIDGDLLKEDPGCALSEDSGFEVRNSVLIVE